MQRHILSQPVPSMSGIFPPRGRALFWMGKVGGRTQVFLAVSAKAVESLETNNYQKMVYIMHSHLGWQSLFLLREMPLGTLGKYGKGWYGTAVSGEITSCTLQGCPANCWTGHNRIKWITFCLPSASGEGNTQIPQLPTYKYYRRRSRGC